MSSVRSRRFDPRGIGGCVGWFDANDSGTVLADNASITLWRDKSGQGCHLDTAIPNSPKLRTNIRNGLHIVRFTAASSQAIGTTTAPLATLFSGSDLPGSIFIAGAAADTAANYTLAGWARASNDVPFLQMLFIPGTPQFRWGKRDDASTALTPALGVTLDASWHIYESCDTGQAVDIIIDGGSQALAQNSNIGAMTITRFAIGCTPRLTPQNAANADIGEVLVYDHYVVDRERKAIERYLANKWQVALTA